VTGQHSELDRDRQSLTGFDGGEYTTRMETPRTTTINVSQPGTLKEFVLGQIRSGAYSSASEHIRDLIRTARERARAKERKRAWTNEQDAGRGVSRGQPEKRRAHGR